LLLKSNRQLVTIGPDFTWKKAPPQDAFSPRTEYTGNVAEIELKPQDNVYIGYEYTFSPPLPYLQSSGPYEKKFRLVNDLTKESLSRKRLDLYFFYRQSPGRNGDEYFQIITLTPHRKNMRFFSQVYGGELRWGDDYLVDPFAQIKDREGHLLYKLPLFEGKVGSLKADKRGIVRKSRGIPFLQQPFKVKGGFAYYYDDQLPEKAGGPVVYSFPDLFPETKN
ncbi:hypothetical protein NLC35_03820, partial [Candidatus Aminicenantes bacterium AC-334-K16]|nr:hypothetical protein [Candidatus Aminicenantes bacterium AC-334-K16]